MLELVIQSGKHQGKRLSLPAGEVFVGRDEDCQIRLTSTDISRRHCVLHVAEGDVRVRDLESRNGTYVNDVQISGEVSLKPGDVLRVGPMVLQFPAARAGGPAKTEPPRAENGGKPHAEPGSKKPAGAKKKATEDDIASWLSEDEEAPSPGDTTIVAGRAPKKAEPAPAPAPAPRASDARSDKKQFHSVQEEAADIIRRHWEAKGRN